MAERPIALVTGATGQVGRELCAILAEDFDVVAPARTTMDLEYPDSVRAAVRSVQPRVVVNAAAYTAVDRAESDVERCTAINSVAPGVLAEETRRVGALLVHYSTDYVFDGAKGAPYVEDDPPAPINVYGRSKLEGERAVAAAGGSHLILRTSWVYGTTGTNFLRTMLRLAAEWPELRVVDDQTGAPTWSRRLAKATATLVRRWLAQDERPESGIYHLTSSGSTTWYGFARAILVEHATVTGTLGVHVVPTTTAEFPTPAVRPRYSVLDNGKVRRRFGVVMPEWSADLAEVLRELSVRAER
jgi:dTDP-4-dehydrorhamnose reductase